ncbi:MAG: hypothetical protein EA361_06960 [Bacteroidetes bacterium]|nr:MAG: hypothetical protein EA361_06960 [Bacteroidota bacterium]
MFRIDGTLLNKNIVLVFFIELLNDFNHIRKRKHSEFVNIICFLKQFSRHTNLMAIEGSGNNHT